MAALVDSLKNLEMDSSVRSLRSQASVASENFFSTNDWDPKPSPAKTTAAPKAVSRVFFAFSAPYRSGHLSRVTHSSPLARS